MTRPTWLLALALLSSGIAAQTTTPWECITETQNTAIATAGGICPLEGNCDDPLVRDGFLVDGSTPIRWLRVHLIVFRADDGSNAAETPADIDAQMARLNTDFLPAAIQFTYTWEYVDDSTYRFATFSSDTMKNLYAVLPGRQLNIFITNLGGGVGTFPWSSDALENTGGLVIGRDFFSGVHRVLTHEMGHCLGLWHTHHGVDEVSFCSPCYETADGVDGDITGDFASDTPPGPADFGNCNNPLGTDSCSGTPWGDTQRNNYMSYGSPAGVACWDYFSPQQIARMHCWTNDILGAWLNCSVGDDCNLNGMVDYCELRDGFATDLNGNSIPDDCEAVAATINPYNGTGANLDTLVATPVVIGTDWSVDLTPQAGRGPGGWILLLRSGSAGGSLLDLGLVLGQPMAGSSELLVSLPAFLANINPPDHTGGGSTANFLAPVPLDFDLLSVEWYAQAVVLGDLPAGAGALDPWFSSATGGTIGSF